MLFRNNTVLPYLSLLSILVACGGNDDKPSQGCQLGDSSGCEGGQICEQVENSQPACFAPLLLRGRVLDSETTKGIASARVVARDVNGELVSRDVAISDADGRYALSIPAPRKQDGTPILTEALLRADAKAHATFPSGLRVALPVDTSAPRKEAAAWVVENGSTDISLDPVTGSESLGSVSGRVEAAAAPGALVVAGEKSSIAGRDGTFEIFDVAAGAIEVRGYK
ncbi:MAG TPA: hypothetical protein VFQ61_08735, partial [Polyangiaceae bacterium]|nr:hypothetical protein [Polyangiaceae bacterium]